MKINDLMDMFTLDSNIDRDRLQQESSNTPALYAKYLNMLHTEVGLLKMLISKKKTMELKKFHYYTGKSDANTYRDSPFEHKVLKTDLPTYIDADKEYRELDDKIELQTNKVKYLESCVKGISSRNWSIRNSIEMIKFNSGVN